jgi:hypothetical protein
MSEREALALRHYRISQCRHCVMSNWTENERLVGLVVLRPSTPSAVCPSGDRRRGRSRCPVLMGRSLRPVVTHLDPDLRRDLQHPFLTKVARPGERLQDPHMPPNLLVLEPPGSIHASSGIPVVRGGAPLRHDALRHCACLSSFQRPMGKRGRRRHDVMPQCVNAIPRERTVGRKGTTTKGRSVQAPSNRPSCPRLFPTNLSVTVPGPESRRAEGPVSARVMRIHSDLREPLPCPLPRPYGLVVIPYGRAHSGEV